MASKNLDKAALKVHPLASTGDTGVARVALTGAAQSIAIPATWRGRFVTVTLETTVAAQYMQYNLSVAAVTLVLNQAATPGAGSAAAGKTVTANQSVDRRIPSGNLGFLNVISSAAGGFIALEVSEGSS